MDPFCSALLYTIFILPIIYFFKWWELWLVIGFIFYHITMEAFKNKFLLKDLL
ncbi:hypothetical protein HCMG_00886 [Helicobacter canadensis MIT 98-5491]|nr:hypothetical protein HCMG_00886 [Helicobacter canadensis MIT 98-5491]